MIYLLAILPLLEPLVWELIDDSTKNIGDKNKTADFFIRIAIGLFASLPGYVLIGKSILVSFTLSMGIHFFLFDYLIAYALILNGTLEAPRGEKYHWYTYTAKKGWMDNIKFWRNLDPDIKGLVRGVALSLSIQFYV